MRYGFAVLRVLAAAAGIAAIVGQLLTSLAYWTSKGVTDIGLSVVNLFSFFTIQSNVAAAAVFLIGAVILIVRRGDDPHWFTVLRACVVTYMVVTGIVYNLLLRGIELPQGSTLEWSNEILHVAVPILMLLDWLFTPGRTPVGWKKIWVVLIFPIVWVIYTMVRGPFTPNELLNESYWYPYPFLNPNLPGHDVQSVIFYIILIALVIAATAAGVIGISRRWKSLRA